MSKVILGWQLNDPIEDQRVLKTIARIEGRYQPLFQDGLQRSGVWHQNQGLLHFDIRQQEDPNFHLGNDLIICLTGRPSITGDGSTFDKASISAKFMYDNICTSANRIDKSLIRQINPPFTFCCFDKTSQRLCLIHDGLGEDQFFVSETSRGIVFSNKCWPILYFLGESPQIDRSAWKYWFCLGWFPENTTPFQNIRVLDKGEIITADSRTVTFSSADAFRFWIKPSADGLPAALMTQAMNSFHQMIRLNQQSHVGYSADLTGGLDSRAICSFLIKERLPCKLYTGGTRLSYDVILAKRIARRFDMEWRHVPNRRFSRLKDLSATMDVQFKKMLLWGEGFVEPGRFQHFHVEPSPTTYGSYLSGGSSEISKGHYYGHLLRENRNAPFDFDRFAAKFERTRVEILPDDDSFNLTHLLRDQVTKGAVYGLEGFSLLDYFYLSERVRRWQSAHLAINLFDRSVLPFVNIEHIKLAFAMRPFEKAEHSFQKFIIAQNAAELLHIPLKEALYRNPFYWCLRAISKINWANRALNNSSWADYFRRDGRTSVEKILSSDTPLWQILDKNKSKRKWDDFLQGTSQEIDFLLGLMSFSYWHMMYIESAGENSLLVRLPQGPLTNN